MGFGDDAAVAGGLAGIMRNAYGEAMFAGDALADPLSGIIAALAALAHWCKGGGALISIALATVIAHACSTRKPASVAKWQQLADRDSSGFYSMRDAQN